MSDCERLVVVTGAGKGMGKAIASKVYEAGVSVVVTAHKLADAEAVVSELRASTANSSALTAMQIDVSSPDGLNPLADLLSGLAPDTMPVIIANAGVNFIGWTAEILQQTFDVNSFGAARTAEAALLAVLRAKAGRFIFMSSDFGQQRELSTKYRELLNDGFTAAQHALNSDRSTTAFKVWNDLVMSKLVFDATDSIKDGKIPCYKLSKAALNVYARLLAKQLARDLPATADVAVYCVEPGWVRTRMGGEGAPQTIDEGASWPVKLALQPSKVSPPFPDALFLHYGKPLEW